MVRQILFLLIGLTLPALMLATDPWAYFHPESIKSYGCKATTAELSLNGVSRGTDVWEAIAFAERIHDKWEMTIGVFPFSLKGRHQAEKACMKWQDQAEKRVHKAQGK